MRPPIQPHSRLNLRRSSFALRVINDWNYLSSDTIESSTIIGFKRHLSHHPAFHILSFLTTPLSIYSAFSPPRFPYTQLSHHPAFRILSFLTTPLSVYSAFSPPRFPYTELSHHPAFHILSFLTTPLSVYQLSFLTTPLSVYQLSTIPKKGFLKLDSGKFNGFIKSQDFASQNPCHPGSTQGPLAW
jgi:hypothetical protein